MTLPEFISAAVAFFGKTEKKLDTVADQSSRITKLEETLETLSAENDRLKADNEMLQANIKASEQKVSEATDKVEKTEQDVERRANLKASQALGSLGVAPVKEETTSTNSLALDELSAKLAAEQDPKKRTILYREHRERIKAAKIANRR